MERSIGQTFMLSIVNESLTRTVFKSFVANPNCEPHEMWTEFQKYIMPEPIRFAERQKMALNQITSSNSEVPWQQSLKLE